MDNGNSFSWISAVDAASTAGNRYDVPGGGVLYCCTELKGCYQETLSRFRWNKVAGAVPNTVQNLAADAASRDTGFMNLGSIPRAWRDARREFRIAVVDAAPFIDIESEQTRAHLAVALQQVAAQCGAKDLDISDIRGRDRALTRAIAKWAYLELDAEENPVYSGLRYVSRHNEQECWAIFDGTKTEVRTQTPINKSGSDIMEVAQLWGLQIH